MRKISTRKDDELLLRLLMMRRKSGSGLVGQAFGMTSEAVRTATNRVVAEDMRVEGCNLDSEYRFAK